MTTAIYLKVASDRRVETERFLRTFDSQTGVSPTTRRARHGGPPAQSRPPRGFGFRGHLTWGDAAPLPGVGTCLSVRYLAQPCGVAVDPLGPGDATTWTCRALPCPSCPWKSRIVGSGEEAPDQLLANPNWRIHPKAQRAALRDPLGSVGFVAQVLVNQRHGPPRRRPSPRRGGPLPRPTHHPGPVHRPRARRGGPRAGHPRPAGGDGGGRRREAPRAARRRQRRLRGAGGDAGRARATGDEGRP